MVYRIEPATRLKQLPADTTLIRGAPHRFLHQKLKTPPDTLEVAKRVIAAEVFGMRLLADSLGQSFEDCVSRLRHTPGRIILSGIGKSGHIARKIGATLASTGTPAQFVHPADASHGDLGMITEDDVVIVFSKSGRTRELGDLTGYCLRFGVTLIAVTAEPDSLLGRGATIVLQLPDAPEACAETRAPTTSSAMMLALGDALAIALLEARGFKRLRLPQTSTPPARSAACSPGSPT